MAKRKIKCNPRKPWGYPANGVDSEKIHWATWCPCGWRLIKLKSEEEAKRLTNEHMKKT